MEEFKFKKKWGQNFISDLNLLNAIVKDSNISSNDMVLEIGAGAGSLTQVLSKNAKKVLAYEIDEDLKENLLSQKLQNVEFVFGDFMKADMKEVEKRFQESLPQDRDKNVRFKVVANLPYYITTPIIFKLLEESENVESLTIMVQKEVAERICANVGGKDYGILTVMIAFYGSAKITRIIKRQMFFPEPNVDSALVHIQVENRYNNINKTKFTKFVKTCFSMRRKTLLNNLSKVYDKQRLRELLSEEKLQQRAETFSLSEFLEIFSKLESKSEGSTKKTK